jgi:hypothetical protein
MILSRSEVDKIRSGEFVLILSQNDDGTADETLMYLASKTTARRCVATIRNMN